MSGYDIAKYLRMGADGVQMATRFVATDECSVADNYKQAYVNAKDEDVVIIESPVGMPGRAIKNKFVEKIQGVIEPFKCNYKCLKDCSYKYCIISALLNAMKGDLDNGLVFCGANVGQVKKIQPVKEVFAELLAELAAA